MTTFPIIATARILRTISLVGALGLFTATGAQAAWSALSDFSASAVSAGLHDNDGWTVGPAGMDMSVAADPANAAARVLAITSSGSYRTAHKAASLPTTATGTLYFRFFIPSDIGAGADVSFGLTNIEAPGEQQTPVSTVRINNTTLQVHDGVFKDVASVQRGVWYECWIVVDNPLDRFEVFLRGPDDTAPVPQSAGGVSSFAFRGATGAEPMRKFQLRANSAHAGKTVYLADVWFDDAARSLSAPTAIPPPDVALSIGPDVEQPWTAEAIAIEATLTGDDADPAQTTFAWSKLSGPGTVTFSTPGAPATDALFAEPGVYVLRLTATGPDQYAVTAEIQITLTGGDEGGAVPDGTYATFKAIHFGPDIRKAAAPWADANGDGVPNLLNFALGLDPLQSSGPAALTANLEPGATGGRVLVLRYPRDPAALVNLTPEWSPDLAAGSWTTAGIGIIPPAESGGLHEAVLPLGDTDPAAFMRLRAELPVAGSPAPTVNGFRGIWYTLGQVSAYGDKYSGGLGTYTSSHTPMAIHAPQVNKTFFTYGGTPTESQRQLQIMVSHYDHNTGLVARPTLVYQRNWVDDPHDNASLSIDEEGHVWLFVSGRNTTREARFFRSEIPFSTERFEDMGETIATYPQPHWFEGHGFLHLFTKYVGGGRLLFWNTSRNGNNWDSAQDRALASIGGHYQTSARHGDRVGTAFNRHPGGSADKRTDLYFLQTDDRGASWQTADGITVATPLTTAANPALVRDYASDNRLVYLQDTTFDAAGRPAILYVTSSHHQPGPDGGPRNWEIAHWQDTHWVFRHVTTSTHNYDVGFLRIDADGVWRIFGPTGTGPQPWGTGGEIALWESTDDGVTWSKTRDVTSGSVRNHGYVRHPVAAHPDFYAYWADGHTGQISRSYLYFSNRAGDRVFRLPYDMTTDFAAPELMP